KGPDGCEVAGIGQGSKHCDAAILVLFDTETPDVEKGEVRRAIDISPPLGLGVPLRGGPVVLLNCIARRIGDPKSEARVGAAALGGAAVAGESSFGVTLNAQARIIKVADIEIG